MQEVLKTHQRTQAEADAFRVARRAATGFDASKPHAHAAGGGVPAAARGKGRGKARGKGKRIDFGTVSAWKLDIANCLICHDSVADRCRTFCGKKREGISRSCADKDHATLAKVCLRDVWDRHLFATGEVCPHAWIFEDP